MTQVRLEADVADALRALAADPSSGVSVAQLANRKLRSVLGLDKPASAPSERRSTITRPGHSTTLDARATLLTRGVEFDSSTCPHPLSRRIGNHCAVCGARVKGTR